MKRAVLALSMLSLLAVVGAAEAAPLAGAAEATPVADEEAELRAEFDAMDADGDGLIDRTELAQMEDAPDEQDIDEFISSFDQDGDGKISYDEIIDDALNNPGIGEGEDEGESEEGEGEEGEYEEGEYEEGEEGESGSVA